MGNRRGDYSIANCFNIANFVAIQYASSKTQSKNYTTTITREMSKSNSGQIVVLEGIIK